jgi:hypothetical protein
MRLVLSDLFGDMLSAPVKATDYNKTVMLAQFGVISVPASAAIVCSNSLRHREFSLPHKAATKRSRHDHACMKASK